jgi:anti-sigma regulatory factor (Ser/Thr protein kinase)
VTTVVLPHAPASVGIARRHMITELTCRGVPAPVVDDAALVLSELVGNAVRHGSPLPGGGVQVTWRRDGAVVHLEVCDGGGGPAGVEAEAGPRESSSTTAEGGRGLAIVSRIAAAWGRQVRDGVTCVSAELRVPVAEADAATG